VAGRILFQRVQSIINIVYVLFKILPVSFRKLIWQVSNVFPGVLGVGLRYCIAKTLADKMGENVYFSPYIIIMNWPRLSIGNNVSIHEFCYIDALGGIEIEDNVSIAHGVSLVSFDHSWDDMSTPIKYNPVKIAPIKICSDVWIGCGAKILKGVKVGPRTIVGAGAVVVNDAPELSLVCGNPAREKKRL